MNSVEIIWEQLLSRDVQQVRAAYLALELETRCQVMAHLRLMTSQEGWHPEQVISAQAALDALAGLEEA
jgi:hypothetical protein